MLRCAGTSAVGPPCRRSGVRETSEPWTAHHDVLSLCVSPPGWLASCVSLESPVLSQFSSELLVRTSDELFSGFKPFEASASTSRPTAE